MEIYYGLTQREWCIVALCIIFAIAGIMTFFDFRGKKKKIVYQPIGDVCTECGSDDYEILWTDTFAGVVLSKLQTEERVKTKTVIDFAREIDQILEDRGENENDECRRTKCHKCKKVHNGIAQYYDSINTRSLCLHPEPETS